MTHASPDTFAFSVDTSGVRPWLSVPTDWRRAGSHGFDVYWSDLLDYGQLLPRPQAEEIASFYDIDYYTHDASGGTRALGFVEKVLPKLAWKADAGIELDDAWWTSALGTEPKRVLEIGCGNGDTLDRLKALGHKVTGVEPDPAARRVAESKGIDVLQVQLNPCQTVLRAINMIA